MGIKVKAGLNQQFVPPGEYLAKVTEIREGTYINKRKIYEFIFEIADGPSRGTIVRGFVNGHYEAFSEYTKLRQWLNTISGNCVEAGEEIDLDIFFNKILRVTLEPKQSRKTKNAFSNVTNILGVYQQL